MCKLPILFQRSYHWISPIYGDIYSSKKWQDRSLAKNLMRVHVMMHRMVYSYTVLSKDTHPDDFLGYIRYSNLCRIFSQNFRWGGDLLLGMIFRSPLRMETDGGGNSCQGRSQMKGDLGKLSTKPKNALACSKTRANFGDHCKHKISFLIF